LSGAIPVCCQTVDQLPVGVGIDVVGVGHLGRAVVGEAVRLHVELDVGDVDAAVKRAVRVVVDGDLVLVVEELGVEVPQLVGEVRDRVST